MLPSALKVEYVPASTEKALVADFTPADVITRLHVWLLLYYTAFLVRNTSTTQVTITFQFKHLSHIRFMLSSISPAETAPAPGRAVHLARSCPGRPSRTGG